LGKLNVLVGINGSGKSNLLEAFSLLRAAPRTPPFDMESVIMEGGGLQNWRWRKGDMVVTPSLLPVVVDGEKFLQHEIRLLNASNVFDILSESISEVQFDEFSGHRGNRILETLFVKNAVHQFILAKNHEDASVKRVELSAAEFNSRKSILANRKDVSSYPEVTRLGEFYEQGIYIYRDWSFGRNSVVRKNQSSDLRRNWLQPDFSNLFLVLSALSQNFKVKQELIEALKGLNPDINDFGVTIDGSYLHVYVVEGETDIPAVRLSDGTLRYLCLLAILLHPNPPSVVCIEEPELGLHPDIIPQLAEHLKSASERCQLIVTTHSDLLIDAMSDRPECVLICERDDKGTHVKPLNAEELAPWLEEYRLGQYWLRGGIGGVR
jgi:predicted ATPase